MNALLWSPEGSPQTGPVLRGNILRVMLCNACNWPLMNPCPMCVQNPIPEVLELTRLCPIMFSDDGLNFHRHCLKWNILMSAVRTQDGVTIGYVPGGISFPMPYRMLAPPVNQIVPQGPLPQGLLHQRSIQQGIGQPGVVHPGFVQQEVVPQGNFHQGLQPEVMQQGFVGQGLSLPEFMQQGLVDQGPFQQGLVPQGLIHQDFVQPGLMPQPIGVLITQVPNGVMLQFVAQSPLVGAPLMSMGVAGPSPQPQADSTQENWAAAPQSSYGSLCDCSDFEQD